MAPKGPHWVAGRALIFIYFFILPLPLELRLVVSTLIVASGRARIDIMAPVRDTNLALGNLGSDTKGPVIYLHAFKMEPAWGLVLGRNKLKPRPQQPQQIPGAE